MIQCIILTPAEAAKILKVSRAEVYYLLNSDKIQGFRYKRGGRWRILSTQLQNYLNDVLKNRERKFLNKFKKKCVLNKGSLFDLKKRLLNGNYDNDLYPQNKE